MTRTPQRVTLCGLCDRLVGVRRNWNNLQAGSGVEEWRVTRHRNPRVVRTPGSPVAICSGSGIHVHPNAVLDTRPARSVAMIE